jgi:hypothetical protein
MGTETSCAFCGTDVGGASVCSRCLLDQNAPALVELRAVSGELFRVEAEIKLLRQKAVELDGKQDALQAVLQWRRRPAPQRTTISDRTPISTDRCSTIDGCSVAREAPGMTAAEMPIGAQRAHLDGVVLRPR